MTGALTVLVSPHNKSLSNVNIMPIYSNFDSGNIQVIDDSNPLNIRLRIHPDNQSEFYQWFHFRLESQIGQRHQISIEDLAGSAYPDGWEDYNVVASYDRNDWFRIPSDYDGDSLSFAFTPECDSMYFAYFAPYSYDRHLNLLHQSQLADVCRLETLGQTLDGRDMSLLTIGEPGDDKKSIWITARQHPGETMAEWFVEGMLERLLDDTDTVASALLEHAVFYVVPNMNPDGSVRGHLRTNAAGINLNREWQTPSLENSPEVYLVRERMLQIGVDMFLDIHGDEAIPYNFVAGSEGVPNYNDRIAELENAFKQALLTITPEFQDDVGYEKDHFGDANLTIGSKWVGNHFECLSYTVEMPFKDHDLHPDALYGWSPQRSYAFGQDTLAAIRAIVTEL